jgi:membrane protease subunit (stomatin/prohibitin family)
MSIINFFTKQFIDVIQWTEEEQHSVLMYAFPMEGKEIQNGATLVVRESQEAVFINEGNFADKFTAGTYRLTTKTLPVLTYLKNWDKLFESPFKSDVYFFSSREKIDQKWGTSSPLVIRDKEFGALSIRAFGNYAYKVSDVEIFFKKITGTSSVYTTEMMQEYLKGVIVTSLSTFLGQSQSSFIDMASNQVEFSKKILEALKVEFLSYGLELTKFFVQNISLPEELQAYLNKAASMKMIGDLGKYAQFQTAESITKAAENPGGIAGAGAGIGAGMAIGQMMQQTMQQPTPQAPLQPNDTSSIPAQDPISLLEKLGELHKKGVITEEEFLTKKTELLAKL